MAKKSIVITDEHAQEAYLLALRMLAEEEAANKHSEVQSTYWADIVVSIERNSRMSRVEVKQYE